MPQMANPTSTILKRAGWLQAIYVATLFLVSAFVMWGSGGIVVFILYSMEPSAFLSANEVSSGWSNAVYSLLLAAGSAVIALGLCFFAINNFIGVSIKIKHLVITLAYILFEDAIALFFHWIFLLQGIDVPMFDRSWLPRNEGWYFLITDLIILNALYYYLRREQARRVRLISQASELEELRHMKLRAELQTLQAKVNPHFLYNSLNSILALISAEPSKAERMVLLLAEFYRSSTGRTNESYASLGEELQLVSNYLEIESIRFEGRFQYQLDVPDELKKIQMPRFLLQPLVENAVKHGVSQTNGQAWIRLRAARNGEGLGINIYDSGPEFNLTHMQIGYGLQSTQDKLHLLSGPNAHLELVNQPEKHISLYLEPKNERTA